MLKYPISTILYLAKINIKDTIKDALKLKNNIDIRLTVTVKDKNGKIIKTHKQHSHSFVANFLDILGTYFINQGINYANTTGSVTSFYIGANINSEFILNLNCGSPGSCGIVIGTGTATPTPEDYELGNQIANGTGSGQMTYNSPSFTNPAVSGNTTTMTITQTFNNQSGASITVSEVGITAETLNNSGGTNYVLIVHDLLSSPITVANLSILQVIYTISVTT